MHSATILCEKGQYYWLWCACKRLIGPVCVVLKTRMLCKNAPTWPASEGEEKEGEKVCRQCLGFNIVRCQNSSVRACLRVHELKLRAPHGHVCSVPPTYRLKAPVSSSAFVGQHRPLRSRLSTCQRTSSLLAQAAQLSSGWVCVGLCECSLK